MLEVGEGGGVSEVGSNSNSDRLLLGFCMASGGMLRLYDIMDHW